MSEASALTECEVGVYSAPCILTYAGRFDDIAINYSMQAVTLLALWRWSAWDAATTHCTHELLKPPGEVLKRRRSWLCSAVVCLLMCL